VGVAAAVVGGVAAASTEVEEGAGGRNALVRGGDWGWVGGYRGDGIYVRLCIVHTNNKG
jgi:hypothetical protein